MRVLLFLFLLLLFRLRAKSSGLSSVLSAIGKKPKMSTLVSGSAINRYNLFFLINELGYQNT